MHSQTGGHGKVQRKWGKRDWGETPGKMGEKGEGTAEARGNKAFTKVRYSKKKKGGAPWGHIF